MLGRRRDEPVELSSMASSATNPPIIPPHRTGGGGGGRRILGAEPRAAISGGASTPDLEQVVANEMSPGSVGSQSSSSSSGPNNRLKPPHWDELDRNQKEALDREITMPVWKPTCFRGW